MVFSCLVDADFPDAEAFYAGLDGTRPDREWPALAELLPAWRAAFDAHMATFSTEGEVNGLRARVLTHVRQGAALEPGLFTLTVPTGGGKTLASLGFTLDHAAQHGKRRIIFAIPYTGARIETAFSPSMRKSPRGSPPHGGPGSKPVALFGFQRDEQSPPHGGADRNEAKASCSVPGNGRPLTGARIET